MALLLPAVMYNIVLTPASVVGGSATVVAATVRLNGQVGPSGAVITLTSSSPGAASVLDSIALSVHAIRGTFTVTTFSVASLQTSTITASFRSTSVHADLTITP